ncbi:MAG: AI-2E family transporter [Planctomycetota bacterium]|nr:AI-2E family transporter [Planctomycetota bacterium]
MDDRRDDSTSNSEQDQPAVWSDLHLWQIRFIRDILFALIFILLFWLGYALRDVTVPLLVALLLAYLAEPAIRWTTRTWWIPFERMGAVIVFVSFFIVVVLATIAFVVPPTVNQIMELVDEVESGSVRTKLVKITDEYVPVHMQSEIIDLLDFLPAPGEKNSAHLDQDVNTSDEVQAKPETPSKTTQAPDKAATTTTSPDDPSSGLTTADNTIINTATTAAKDNAGVIFGIVRQGGSIAWSVILDLITIGMLLFLIPFYFFFFSLWYADVAEFINKMIPERGRHRTRDLLLKMDEAVAGFVRGRILISIIMSVMFVIGYMVVGVPYAILLGILAGFISIVPYLGLVAIPVSIVLMFIGQLEVAEADRMAWWGVLLWPTVVYAVVGTVDGWILTPWIQGKSTNLDPITIFVAILAGGSVLGVYGMLIAIPVAACIKILLSEVVLPKLRELGTRPAAGKPLL